MHWTEEELKILSDKDLTHKELCALLPGKSYDMIRRKSYKLGLQRSMKKAGRISQEAADAIWAKARFQELIEGHLLGDGCIDSKGHAFRLGTNIQAYARKLQNELNMLADKKNKLTYHPPAKKIWKTGEFTSKESWTSVCCCKPIFWKQRERWYPDGEKVVPGDLQLTPTIINRWYIDDGYLTVVPNRSITTVSLCTDSFSDEHIDFLRDAIGSAIGIDTGTCIIHRKFRRIVIYTKARVEKFLDYIGSPPVTEYSYKWEL